MSEHTPGPWSAFQWGDQSQADTGLFNVGSDSAEVVLVKDIPESDARLIAAAPELLEALEEFVEEFDGCYAEGEPAMIKARAAIAKARK